MKIWKSRSSLIYILAARLTLDLTTYSLVEAFQGGAQWAATEKRI